jgi:anaerobic magnesium-protoporphyrin IX monomethyl ester cyclase
VPRGKILFVDLNNYARFPTLAIGYLVAPLRAAGYEVELLSPLALGQPGVMREHQDTVLDHVKRSIYMAPPAALWRNQDWMYDRYAAWRQRLTKRERTMLEREIERRAPNVILLSAYLSHQERVEFIAAVAERRGIPVLVGGPFLNTHGVAADWARIPGVNAVFAGEAEFVIVDLVDALIRGLAMRNFRGLFVHPPLGRGHEQGGALEPLGNLDELPVPDFEGFPWGLYPHRIVPLMASRGCGWGRCTFCSDVITASGRGFRSRTIEHVLHEIEVQSKRYAAKDFIFLDIKLNSDVGLWRGIVNGIQERVSGARWIGTVHVNAAGDSGLDEDTIMRAGASGLTRVSFGLESGSQRMLRRMAKGCVVELNEQFVRTASRAGISVRSTMITGYPGESADDVDQSTRFLERNVEHIDRVNLSRFKIIPGTRFELLYKRWSGRFNDVRILDWNHRYGRASHQLSQLGDRRYRRAVRGLLRAVHAINLRPLRNNLEQFDGLM